jgi:predicted nucleotidyltransferase
MLRMKFIDEDKVPHQPYPELREVLHRFVEKVSAQLGENLVGIYLVGSLASGDFDADSDVDFLVVTHAELTEEDMQPLQEIQTQIHEIDCYPARHLEGSYISMADLNDASTVGQKALFYFDNGSTAYERSTHDNQWHVRWILRERGITLLGLKPETLLGPIPLDEMFKEIKAAMRVVIKYFGEDVNAPRTFWNSRFGQPFAVLTYCRMLHSLHTGTVQSKKAGAAWAREFVDAKWVKVIDDAWIEREGVRFMEKIFQRADQTTLDETLEFMKYALSKIGPTDV